ncbi:hypothetical protein [Streptomyces sp. NPDC093105]|uniref:hypothetical protein n=1 Tax=Streptomyces sp. NPDC093105 TaxID=3366029 RepID=UPI0038188018
MEFTTLLLVDTGEPERRSRCRTPAERAAAVRAAVFLFAFMHVTSPPRPAQ